ncbi:hypothetical protein VTI28DRAFT_10159 [Corynascus sepedonium]
MSTTRAVTNIRAFTPRERFYHTVRSSPVICALNIITHREMADDEQLSIYDEVEIEDMTYDETLQIYHYPCPCGDRFEIALCDLMDGEDIGVCPSCSLMIRVIFEVDNLPKPPRQGQQGEQVVVAA